ncbi:hydrolase [Kaarinaea lacus]
MNSVNSQLLADVSKSQLVVIDVQNRLTPVMSNPESLLRNCNILIQAASLLEVPITVTEQYPRGIGNTNAELIDSLGSNYKPIEKTCFSCCGSDEFNSSISQHSQRKQIIVCGIEAHVCVLQTTLELLGHDTRPQPQIFVVADAIDSRNEKNKNLALSRLQQAGAVITCTESVVFEWLKNSKNNHFKQISALIR